MTTEDFKRKLTAILSADVVGYSRLMGEDEEATVRTLNKYKQIIFDLIERHNGRIIDSPGDNVLAEFASVVDAVRCVVQIQEDLKGHNDELPPDRKMELRIGINTGDVIQDGDRIYGDGVNVAARIESLADPGGICISRTAYDQVKGKIDIDYEYLGEYEVKNIKEPVRVYKIQKEKSEVKITTESKTSFTSEKPSIVVLPFVNMSNDPDQEYFSDGMAEEIIGVLVKLEGLKVISRTSAFFFKGKDVNLRTIGKELNVEHVLEGSVRKAGKKIRITAQLIKVSDDTHLWSENYDRELEDVFTIQDEISQAVVKNLKVRLLDIKNRPLVKDYTKNTEAYELFLKGKYFFSNTVDYEKAVEYMEKAIKVDPDYAPAYVQLVQIHGMSGALLGLPPDKAMLEELLNKAYLIDDSYGFIHAYMGRNKINEYDWQGAKQSFLRAIELSPGDSRIYHEYSHYLAATNQRNEALKAAKRAFELDPLSSLLRSNYVWFLALNHEFDKAIKISKESLTFDPNNSGTIYNLGFTYGYNGMYEDAVSILKNRETFPYLKSYLGYIYGQMGNTKEAEKILLDFLDRSENSYFSPYMIAMVYSGLRDYDKVFEWLDLAHEVRDPIQFYIKVDPCFSSLHSDPRWVDVLTKRRLID